jgi:hypothetical protein
MVGTLPFNQDVVHPHYTTAWKMVAMVEAVWQMVYVPGVGGGDNDSMKMGKWGMSNCQQKNIDNRTNSQ